jgi:hypothetical protein
MHTRRMATFLLGAWLGCSLFMSFLAVQNLRSPNRTLANATPPATKLAQKLGEEDALLFLRFQASEQNRTYLFYWELVEFLLALTLGGCLFLGTQRRILPLVFREADFPPGSRAYGTQMRLLLMEQGYIGTEAAKLVIGGILASYLFVFRAPRRVRKKVEVDGDVDASLADG